MRDTSFPLAKIGSFASKVASWNPKREGDGQEINYIDLGAVDNKKKEINGYQKINTSDAPSRARQIVKSGDIIVSTVRPNLNGVACIPSNLDGATGSTGFCVLRPDPDKLDPHYLFQWVKTPEFVADMTSKASGQSYPAVSDKLIFNSEIPLPPLDEQKRIAAILDQADALRRLRQRALDKLQTLGQSIFYEMFGDQSADVEYKSLIECVIDIQIGPFGSLLHKSDYIVGGVPLINPMHIIAGEVVPDPKFSVPESKLLELGRYRMKAGDIVMGRRGEMGRCAIIGENEDGFICGTGSLIIRPNHNVLSPEFLQIFLSTSKTKRNLENAASGVTMLNLNAKALAALPTPIPNMKRQKLWSSFLDCFRMDMKRMSTALETYQSLFTSLQQRAFRGEL